jgi:uncharacterized protein YkwD
MKLARTITHLFLPHESNNLKAKILHAKGLLSIKVLLVVFQIVITFTPLNPVSRILGYAANISPQEVIILTNEKRAEAGLAPLVENPTLSQAALAKGTDMINKNYWAHVAPDGTQPWAFFINAGYRYRYAGENLARDFSNAPSAVNAWMASPSHKENLLSPKYKEIGIGVIEGDLNGVDTTIIVQFFGTNYLDTIPVQPIAEAPVQTTAPTLAPTPASTPTISPTFTPLPISTSEVKLVNVSDEEKSNQVLVSPFTSTKEVSIAVVGLLLLVLILDAAITSRRRITRIGGRTFAHLSFLGMILAIVLILKAGQIL